jgi:hypothetical protein
MAKCFILPAAAKFSESMYIKNFDLPKTVRGYNYISNNSYQLDRRGPQFEKLCAF